MEVQPGRHKIEASRPGYLSLVMGSISGLAGIAALVFFLIDLEEQPEKVVLGIEPDGIVISGVF